MVGYESQESIAEQAESSDDIWISASGAVFTPTGILTPVVSDFHSSPMGADQARPSLRAAFLGFQTAEIVAALRAAWSCFGTPHGFNAKQRSGIRPVDGHGLDGRDEVCALFQPAMTAFA